MRNFILLLLLISYSGKQLSAQKMIPGYIVTNDGDSLTGYISGRDMKNYNDSILFEQDKGTRKVVSKKDCRAFGTFKSGERFERWTVTLDMTYFDKDMYLINADSVKTDSFFLKIIYKGLKVSLYYYKDPVTFKEHFFIRSGSSMETLIQKYRKPTIAETLRPGRSPNFVMLTMFRDQFYKYFDWQNNRQLKLKVDFAEYFYPKMVSIVKAIDKEQSGTK